MGIFKRLHDIISANLNELVDGLENPELTLRQAVEEMEVAIAESKREVARAMASEKLGQRELEANRQQVRDWQGRAEKAVQAKDESLARMALGRKQEYAAIVAALEEQALVTKETTQLLREQLDAMQAKHGEAKRKLGMLAARLKAAQVRAKVRDVAVDVQFDQSAFRKFEKVRARVERVEAEAEAMRELERSGLRDPEAMRIDAALSIASVEAELETLKRTLES